MNNDSNAREAALKILHRMQGGEYINAAIKNGMPQRIKKEDKALASQLVYGVISNRTRLDFDIASFSKIPMKKISPWITDILRMGFYQLFFLDRIPASAAVNEAVKLAKKYGHSASAGFVNGVMRRAAREGEPPLPEDLSVIYSHPRWITDMWIKDYGAETAEKILRVNNTPPEALVRANTLKISSEELAEKIGGEKIDDLFVRLDSLAGIEYSSEYLDGLLTVQGQTSARAVIALEPKKGQLVLDLCAAPGGKSTLSAQLMENQGEIIACDIHSHRLDLIEKNARRMGVNIIKTRLQDAAVLMPEYIKKADCVLADVPCSGLGVIRKKPDIRWDKKPEDISSLCTVQENILNTASAYVKKGGRLVYSTCTLCEEENGNMIRRFLDRHSGFELVWEKQYFPFEKGCDGFYIGVLVCRE